MDNKKQIFENCFQQSFLEGEKITEIQVTGTGNLEVYLSPAQQRRAKGSLDQSMKLFTLAVDRFPIGFPDILSPCGTYHFSYMIHGDDKISHEATDTFQKMEPLIENSADGAHLVEQCFGVVQELYRTLTELMEFNQEVEQIIRCTSAFYWYVKETCRISREPKTSFLKTGKQFYEQLYTNGLPKEFSIDQFENCLEYFAVRTHQNEYDLHTGKYISTLMDMPKERRNSFLQENSDILVYHCIETSRAICQFKKYLISEFTYSKDLLRQIFCNTEDGLITEFIRILVEINENTGETAVLPDFICYISERYKASIEWMEEKYECSLGFDINKLNILLTNMQSSIQEAAQESISMKEDVLYQLLGSMSTILDFSELALEKKSFLKNFIENFKEYGPRIENIPTENRRNLNAVFFELYESVAMKYMEEETQIKALDMFLLFGFIDSDLLMPAQVHGLYQLLDQFSGNENIYSMKDWLKQITSGEKIPSVNELGTTYAQALKEQRYKGTSRNSELDTPEHRLHYEIMNMLRTGHRVCSGQFGAYFPILYKDMLPEDIRRVAITPERIEKSLEEILEKDFSAFHREVFYSGNQEVFRKELIMKQVIPDFILVPVAGTRALMWQEISGVTKSSKGRFVMPILTSEDLTNMLVKLTGQFRWELCRSVMGVRWNDISYHSLTATYADYIDNYKRNKNLTSEAKERLRSQIKRYRNNLRNLFAADYELWLRYEYRGMRKLNKEARSIFYQFCPFRSLKRKEFFAQPAFADIAARFENDRRRTAREIENRYAAYIKRGHVLEPELEENLKFYKEL